jgi:hypothetical protein
MTLAVVMDVYHGKVNDVVICENERAKGTYYTVIRITNHNTVKKFLAMMEQYPDKKECVIDMFNSEDGFLVVMGYCRPRNIRDFFATGVNSVERAERISLNLIAECIGSSLPYPLLELVLKERNIQLLQDDSVTLGYMTDLEPMNVDAGEAECAHECARIVRELITPVADKRTMSLQILDKKIPLRNYKTFREIYRDIHIILDGTKKQGFFGRIKSWFARNQEGIFRVLLWISIILLILVVLMVLSNVIFGDIPFMRIFFNSFKKIGTESMLQ